MISRTGWQLFLLAACLIAATFARGETYRGLLVPNDRLQPIPVVVDLEDNHGILSGQVTTSAPLTAQGQVTGDKLRFECKFKADLGEGRQISFDGFCLQSAIEGEYSLLLPDLRLQKGTYRLMRMEEEKPAPKAAAPVVGPPPIAPARTTACLSANATCLASCPRGNYNAEFLCATRCRQRFTACKRGSVTGSSTAETPVPSFP